MGLLLAASLALGSLLAVQPVLGLVAAVGVVVVTVLARATVVLPVVGVPAVFLAWRVGGSGPSSISLADLTLLVGATAAVMLVDWRNTPLRRFMALFGAYEGILLIVVLANPSSAAAVEWGHRLLLLAGSVVVGAALAQQGKMASALRLYLFLAAAVSVAAVTGSVLSGLAPAFPLGLSKNFAGGLLMMAVLLTVAAPSFTGFAPRTWRWLRVLLLLGLMATQSRGAITALAAGIVVWVLVNRRLTWGSLLAWAVALVMVIFVVSSLQSDPTAQTSYGSIGSRREFSKEAIAAWQDAPLFGKGIRFYQQADAQLRSNPHNAVTEALAESGIFGTAGLALLLGLTVVWLRRMDHPIAMAALLLVIANFVHGLVDIYWLAGTDSLPWIVAGMATVVSVRPARGGGRRDEPLAVPGGTRGVAPGLPQARPAGG